jgi:hypothetical protein
MESTWLRSLKMKMGSGGKGGVGADICSVFLRDAIARIESAARTVIGACCNGETADRHTDAVRKLATFNVMDTVALRRRIAEKVISGERYPF